MATILQRELRTAIHHSTCVRSYSALPSRARNANSLHRHHNLDTPAPLRSTSLIAQQSRYASFQTSQPLGAVRTLLRKYPIQFPLAVTIILAGAAGFVYVSYLWADMYAKLGTYPEKVGLKLRRAIYFTDIKPDSAQALKAYIEALQLANEDGMDGLSDEVIGIKQQLCRFLEKTNNFDKSITVLESVRDDCLTWLDHHGSQPDAYVRRARLLRWACRLSTKLAELYSNPYFNNTEKVEEHLVWAVETTLKEQQRRDRDGVKDGECDWLTVDEVGTQLEDLGHHFEENNNHYFASQLFLQALMLKQPPDCHSVILMNNLAAAIAQQVPPTEPGTPPPSQAQLRESGRTWLKQALALARSIEEPERNAECDRGCVVAIHNLGEFAEMDGNIAEARNRYEQAGSIAHSVGFEEGVISSKEGLKRLSGSNEKPMKEKPKGWW